MRSRRPRSSSGASITTSGSAERNQPDRPSVKRAVAGRAIAPGRRLSERHGRDPLPKSLPATAARFGERSRRTVVANAAGRESAGMIQTNGLTKQLGGRTVVSDVTFRCEPGTVTGFLGPNGAGKTIHSADARRPLAARQRHGTDPRWALPRPAEPGPACRHPARRVRPARRAPRPRGARRLRPHHGRAGAARRRAAAARRPRRDGGPAPCRQVLARHAPAPGLRPRTARRPRGPDPRRARQWPRSGRHALDARPAAQLRRPRRHRAALLAPAGRGRGRRRPDDDHRQRPDPGARHPRRAADRIRDHRRGRRPRRPRCRASPRRPRDPPGRRRSAAGRGRAGDRRPRGHGRRRGTALACPSRGRRPRTSLLRADDLRRRHAVDPDRFHPSRAAGSNRMTTTTLVAPIRKNTAGVHARPGLGRLVAVELRKMVDTRAGFWLQVAMVALTVVVVVVRLLVGDAPDHTFQSVLDAGLQPSAVLLPVLGILLVTSEWSQRTGLITFALVPVRSRVLGAKLIASLLRAVAMLAISLAVVAAGVLVSSPGVEGTWSDAAPLIGQSAVNLTAGMVIGVAFGAILLTPAPAIVLLFALPTAWMAVLSLPVFSDVAPWVDYARALGQMTEERSE